METKRERTTDPAYDVLRSEREPLNAFFNPGNVAVIGATEKAGSVGRTILWNLISTPFGGAVFPVNPNRGHILGVKAYRSLDAISDPVDLAILVTPAASVPDLIDQCVDRGVQAAIIISAGFKEVGPEGVELERRIAAHTQARRIRVIGPNCLGVMRPISGLNATFAAGMARKGNVAMLSQSGALCTAVLDWSYQEQVGFSALISVGSMLDVSWGDLISYFGNDPYTESIVIYMETIGDARSFVSAAREVALTKPIILIKAGRTEAAAKAAASHTGSLAGSADVLDAALRRCGVLRVDSIGEMFEMAEVLAKQKLPRGPRLSIVTNAGGPAVLATDALITAGGQLATLAPETVTTLNAQLPAHWSHANPVDILGDADAERYAKTLQTVANDANSDGLLVILTPQAMTDSLKTAEGFVEAAKHVRKPLFASWMGGPSVADGLAILAQAGIPTFQYPDAAARAFQAMWRYSDYLRLLYETPTLPPPIREEKNSRTTAAALIDQARASGRELLTEIESKQILAAYQIPTVETFLARDVEEAVAFAQKIGFPIVLKLHSETLTHKTDVGGVRLNLTNETEVRDAFHGIRSSVAERAGAEHFHGAAVQPMIKLEGYEVILGSSVDPQFGPVMLFGSGGQLVEVYKDRALALPPLTSTLARRMMERTRIFEALKGVRGRKPVDLDALAQLVCRFSELVTTQRWIKEIDINPLIVSPDRMIAVDARVVLHPPSVTESQLPRLAIRPYPTQYVSSWTMRDGSTMTIRPIRPEDEPLMVRFHGTLSEQSVYFRFFNMLQLSQRVAHDRLSRLCFIDYDRAMALVVEKDNEQSDQREIVGVGRLTKVGNNKAEFAIVVSDRYQRQGLGEALLTRLVQIGRDEKLRQIRADILAENRAMQRVSEKVGFQLKSKADGTLISAELNL